MTIETFKALTKQTFKQLQLSYLQNALNTTAALAPIRKQVADVIDRQHANLPELLDTLLQMHAAMDAILAELTDPVTQNTLFNKIEYGPGFSKDREMVRSLNIFSLGLPAHFSVAFLASINEGLLQLPELALRIANDGDFCVFLATCLSNTPAALGCVESMGFSMTRHWPKLPQSIEVDNQAFMSLYQSRQDGSSLFKALLDELRRAKPNATAFSLAAWIQQGGLGIDLEALELDLTTPCPADSIQQSHQVKAATKWSAAMVTPLSEAIVRFMSCCAASFAYSNMDVPLGLRIVNPLVRAQPKS